MVRENLSAVVSVGQLINNSESVSILPLDSTEHFLVALSGEIPIIKGFTSASPFLTALNTAVVAVAVKDTYALLQKKCYAGPQFVKKPHENHLI